MRRRELLTNRNLISLVSGLTAQATSQRPLTPSAGPRANYFPNVILRTHENRPVRFYDDLIRNKLVVINMMYAQCTGICPGMTANLARVQKLLGDRVGRDIFMYSLTLEPAKDTPQVLKRYAEMYNVKPGWTFLTGKPSDMEQLRRKLGFVNPDPVLDKDKAQHIGLVRYGNEALDRWAACPALSNPQQIAKSILWMEGAKKRES